MNKTIICVSILICVFFVINSTQARRGSRTKFRNSVRSQKTWGSSRKSPKWLSSFSNYGNRAQARKTTAVPTYRRRPSTNKASRKKSQKSRGNVRKTTKLPPAFNKHGNRAQARKTTPVPAYRRRPSTNKGSRKKSQKSRGNVRKTTKLPPAFSNYGNRAQARKTTPVPAYRRRPSTNKGSRKKSQKSRGDVRKTTKLPPAFNKHGNRAQARKTTPVPASRRRQPKIKKHKFASVKASPRQDTNNFFNGPNRLSQSHQGLNNYAQSSRPFPQATAGGNGNYDVTQVTNPGSNQFRGANLGQNLLSLAAGYLGGMASRPDGKSHQTGNENPGTNKETELASTTEQDIEVINNEETQFDSTTEKVIEANNNEETELASTTEAEFEYLPRNVVELIKI